MPDLDAINPLNVPIPVRKTFAVSYAKSFARFDLVLREHCRKVLLHLYDYDRAAKEKGLGFLELGSACEAVPKGQMYSSLAAHVTLLRLNLIGLNKTGDNVFNKSQVNNNFMELSLEIGTKLLPIDKSELDPDNEGKFGLVTIYVPFWKTRTKAGQDLSALLQKTEADLLRDAAFDIGGKLIEIHTKPEFTAIAQELCQSAFQVYVLEGFECGSMDLQYLDSGTLVADWIPQWIARLYDALKNDLPKLAITLDFFYNVLWKHGTLCEAQALVAYQMKIRGILTHSIRSSRLVP